ncbi:unnamed protein product [Angiostrongylus costaricensis]|uniref:Secreted protein n=1 Tax=Angiostrongylus costaricensis TaxID=334426 RepID=A0A158PIS1_ANGCS|nr:unnamed protein product [Angiostrongylus costaricensis]
MVTVPVAECPIVLSCAMTFVSITNLNHGTGNDDLFPPRRYSLTMTDNKNEEVTPPMAEIGRLSCSSQKDL